MTVKALNDTTGPNGLLPTLILFDVMPRIPTADTAYPDLNARVEAM